MHFFIFVILLCLFLFLYCVYVLANDDFIFLRRDITMDKLFNIIFLGGAVSLFTARLFYGVFNAKNVLSNPFIFLLFPYYPGLSLLGSVIGVGVVFVFLKTRKKDPLPLGRIADFFSIAFLISLPIGFIGYLMFSAEAFSVIKAGTQAAIYFTLFIIFLKFLLPSLLNGKFKEGTITYIFLVCFSMISLISNAFPKISILNYLRNFENTIFVLILVSSVVLLFRSEDLLLKIKQLRKGK